MKRNFLTVVGLMWVVALLFSCQDENDVIVVPPEENSSEFVVLTDVVPDVILEIRYYGTYNFIGRSIPGYDEPIALLTRQAADSLKRVSDDLVQQGYRLKVFDGYRPQKAVDYFMEWAVEEGDTLMKPYFYPELDKSVLVPQEYVAERSGHTRGSTIDLTLFDMRTEKEVDMGCTYDYFGLASHPDVLPGQPVGAYRPINQEQYDNRMILQKAMMAHGFKPYECEWWHFTLANDPFPDTYFTFPIARGSLKGNGKAD
ncbi:MAG: M15 family metallopeptidase [Parabacteroides sp.]